MEGEGSSAGFPGAVSIMIEVASGLRGQEESKVWRERARPLDFGVRMTENTLTA